MARFGLNRVEIEGYTSIEHVELTLGAVTVFVGANGTGKSNFNNALGLLGRIADQELARRAGLNGGASALLNRASALRRIRLGLSGARGGYRAALVPGAGDNLIFEYEVLEHSAATVEELGGGHRETRLFALADSHGKAGAALDLLRGCRVFHFHDTSRNAPVKQFAPTAENLTLRSDAGNLAAVLSWPLSRRR
ncbi:DUF2813 domain-containing protein [Actinokineospora auranticolor]|uniref:Uncharacterized protein DUF2813 n=1 Tax=Actinokineospora auranticolor TaxID=155976 RepID=A0A2S6GY86_9PSEU|nr:DUF2813 domain-containing protein [Actinokineospora auranticolor]PPK70121.1 uncharacterized protein DUF2813 [Actinokineospora auranticolor]